MLMNSIAIVPLGFPLAFSGVVNIYASIFAIDIDISLATAQRIHAHVHINPFHLLGRIYKTGAAAVPVRIESNCSRVSVLFLQIPSLFLFCFSIIGLIIYCYMIGTHDAEATCLSTARPYSRQNNGPGTKATCTMRVSTVVGRLSICDAIRLSFGFHPFFLAMGGRAYPDLLQHSRPAHDNIRALP
jgi:hypothetical protein